MKKMKKALALILALAMALSMTTMASAVSEAKTVVEGAGVVQIPWDGSVTEEGASGISIESKYEGFNPIIVHDSEYTLKDANIVIESDGDGTVCNDFSGYGAAIATYGDSTILTIEDSSVYVSGVGNLAVFVDDGSDVIIKNSKLHSEGGTLYESYKNSPDQSTMVAPPWILGIMGTSRCTNLMGNNSSMTVIDSETTAAQWAILSTDSGTNMTLNVVNTYMGLTGANYPLQEGGLFTVGDKVNGADANPYTNRSGYGTYTIGNSNQKFWGVDMVVGTYANIYTGGKGLYTAMKAGETISLKDANGVEVATYTPAEDKVTTINSDTFGFMIHQGSNSLTLEKGTVVNSEYTSMLLKTGCTMDALISSGTVLNPGNGILLQVLDNDDATTGMHMSEDGRGPDMSKGFLTEHVENPGWPTVASTKVNSASTFTYDDVTLVGDIFNGSGWVLNSQGEQKASPIVVTLSGSTTLEGQISATAAIHVTKAGSDAIKAASAGQKASESWVEYQNCSFPIGQYYDIGQVANMVAYSGVNNIDVVITDDAVWTVTADGIVTNITADSDAIVSKVPVTLTVAGTLTLDGAVVDLSAGDHTVGNVVYTKSETAVVEPEAGGGGGMGPPPGGGGDPIWYTEDQKVAISVKDGVVVEAGTEGATVYELDRLMYGSDDNLSSFSGGGHVVGGDDDYAFATALYVNGGEVSYPLGYTKDNHVTHGSYGYDRGGNIFFEADPRYATSQNENGYQAAIIDNISWHNGVVYDAAGEWTMTGEIHMNSDADGSDTNDFSGLGAAIMVNGCDPVHNPEGKQVKAYIENAIIKTAGVAKLALFTDGGAISIVKNTKMYADGGVIYDGYMSTADQSVMVSPPWVLGLGGNADEPCNARTTNLMGDYSVAAYVDSYFYAKGWGALSVDSGTNMNMVVVNTEVDVETSGYGAYNIGNSTEDYYGSKMDVSTYAIIMTGGETTWKSYTGGQEIDVVQFSGEKNAYGHGINGTVVETVKSDKVAEGVVVPSEIISDNFGFMCHNNGGSGWNVVNVLDGTKITTGDAIFLVKKVCADLVVDNAVLESGNDVLVQIIDNDDDYVGLDFAANWGHENEYGHTIGGHMPTFNSKFVEEEGFSDEWISELSAANRATLEPTESEDSGVATADAPPAMPGMPGGSSEPQPYDVSSNWVVNYTMTNTVATGDLWNSTGYVGSNNATTMNVALGEGAELTGVISAGAFSHTTKYAEVGDGDWTGAEALGHVINKACSNGVNLVNVVLTDDAKWNVTADSIVDTLVASSEAIVAAEKVTISINGELTLDGKVIEKDVTIGNVTYDVAQDDSPKTGDNSYVVIMACVALAAAACFVVLNKKKA